MAGFAQPFGSPFRVLTGSLLVPALAFADPASILRDAEVVDAIGVSRVADEAGDALLKKYLAGGGPRELQLVAARAAPAADAPEQLIGLLVPLALGRDPQVAPEAAQALSAIGEQLKPSGLAAREVLMSDLHKARAALELEPEREPRADIALVLRELAAALAALGAREP